MRKDRRGCSPLPAADSKARAAWQRGRCTCRRRLRLPSRKREGRAKTSTALRSDKSLFYNISARYAGPMMSAPFPADMRFACEAARDSALFYRDPLRACRSEEHTSELQSLMRISYAVFCLKKKNTHI